MFEPEVVMIPGKFHVDANVYRLLIYFVIEYT